MDTTTAYIALGSNLGDRADYIRRAVGELALCDGVSVTGQSAVEETTPLGMVTQDVYLNSIVKVETNLSPDDLFACMVKIENSLGRVRDAKWGPRTIDLDLLLYGGKIIETAQLCVPHKQMHLRSFVLRGMCRLDGKLVHPVLNETMDELSSRLKGKDFVIDSNKPQLISIAGVIGAGKTTLGEGLSSQLDCQLLREAYDTNPYLAAAYAGNEDRALDSQLYFLNSRLEQLEKDNLPSGQAVITDYVFEKDRIFARRTLTDDQFAKYSGRLREVEERIAEEVLVIYLRQNPTTLLDRIHGRNRPYEQRIELGWLESLADEYEKLFAAWDRCPVITINTDMIDLRRQEDVAQLAEEVRSYICTS